MFVRHVGESALTAMSGERESNLEKAAKEIKWTSFVVGFFAALQDGGLLEICCFSSMVPSMVPLANAS